MPLIGIEGLEGCSQWNLYGELLVKEFFNHFATWYPCFRAAGKRTKACYLHTVLTYVDTEGSLPGASNRSRVRDPNHDAVNAHQEQGSGAAGPRFLAERSWTSERALRCDECGFL